MRINVQHIVIRALIVMAFVSAAVACFGQGQIQFLTFNVDPTKGKMCAPDGTTPLDNTYYGQLLGGTSSTSLAPIGSPVAFLSGAGAGYINGPTVNISGTFGGDTYYYALAAWSSTAGNTYAAALASQGFVFDSRGFGAPVQVTLGGTPAGGGTPLGYRALMGLTVSAWFQSPPRLFWDCWVLRRCCSVVASNQSAFLFQPPARAAFLLPGGLTLHFC